ncbi:MAG TPA: aldolase/citrate lyase family protein [Nakamurella sp.]|nr:aldolase/citrate lyase family protein [Nakamurella sp.]
MSAKGIRPGVDVVFVGPADLSTALGVPGDLDGPGVQGRHHPHRRHDPRQHRLRQARRDRGGDPGGGADIVTAARQAGIASGILSRNADHAAACLEDGFSFVGVGSDATLLASSATPSRNRSRTGPADRHDLSVHASAGFVAPNR